MSCIITDSNIPFYISTSNATKPTFTSQPVTREMLVESLRSVRNKNYLKSYKSDIEEFYGRTGKLPPRFRKFNTPQQVLLYMNHNLCLELPQHTLIDMSEDEAACLLHDLSNHPLELVHERLRETTTLKPLDDEEVKVYLETKSFERPGFILESIYDKKMYGRTTPLDDEFYDDDLYAT